MSLSCRVRRPGLSPSGSITVHRSGLYERKKWKGWMKSYVNGNILNTDWADISWKIHILFEFNECNIAMVPSIEIGMDNNFINFDCLFFSVILNMVLKIGISPVSTRTSLKSDRSRLGPVSTRSVWFLKNENIVTISQRRFPNLIECSYFGPVFSSCAQSPLIGFYNDSTQNPEQMIRNESTEPWLMWKSSPEVTTHLLQISATPHFIWM